MRYGSATDGRHDEVSRAFHPLFNEARIGPSNGRENRANMINVTWTDVTDAVSRISISKCVIY